MEIAASGESAIMFKRTRIWQVSIAEGGQLISGS